MEKKIPKLTVQLLTAIAVTLALVMIVENYFSIRLSDTLQGPVWAAVFAAISDPVFVLFSGQTVLFTWILIEAVSAFIYGWFFYQKPLDIKNKADWFYVAGVVVLIQIVISFIMTPIALHFHFETPWIALYSSRLIKAVFEIPLRIVVTMLVLPNLQKIPEFAKLMGIK
jgi:ECF transporter S component (folate family)